MIAPTPTQPPRERQVQACCGQILWKARGVQSFSWSLRSDERCPCCGGHPHKKRKQQSGDDHGHR